MSAEDERVEAVRAVYERWGAGDFASGVEPYAEDVELVLRPDFPDPGSYRGVREIWIETVVAEEDALAAAGAGEAAR
jgi:ketosteroid isomerase-like protein